jgi:ferric-dicitrate binding protein FerR (iron transport regulator)
LRSEWHAIPVEKQVDGVDWTALYARISGELAVKERAGPHEPAVVKNIQPRFSRRIYRMIAVASILVLLTAGGYWWSTRNGKIASHVAVRSTTPIAPGGNHAILTLPDGQQLVIDSLHNGTVAMAGNRPSTKTKDGELVYDRQSAADDKAAGSLYTTVSTPRGGEYAIVLPDGTRVWLNAASSIRFPVVFTGTARRIELKGEACFEVARNASLPFTVHTATTAITAIGTTINISSYDDEPTEKTTLAEGGLKVVYGQAQFLLHPGQQTVVDRNTGLFFSQAADVQKELAWKNGRFEFDNADLRTIMRQISRWYDVDIKYETNIGNARFGGGISRRLNLSEVLHLLESNGTGVHFRTAGRQVIVAS